MGVPELHAPVGETVEGLCWGTEARSSSQQRAACPQVGAPPAPLPAPPVRFSRKDDPLGVESSIYPSSQGHGPFPETLQLASARAGPGEGIQGGRAPLNSQVGLWGPHTPSLLQLHGAPSCHSSAACHLALPSGSELLVGPVHVLVPAPGARSGVYQGPGWTGQQSLMHTRLIPASACCKLSLRSSFTKSKASPGLGCHRLCSLCAPQIRVWKSGPQGDGVRRWGLWR